MSAIVPLARTHPGMTVRRLVRRALGVFVASVMALTATTAFATSGPPQAPAHQTEAGLPFIHHFDPPEYGGSAQNWAITQGANGVMYFGNVTNGVLAFDGTRWRHIPVPNQLVVRSLATAPDGRIYVGSVGDFGYLKPDSAGQMSYVSLLSKVPADAHDFTDVWNIFTTGKDVYFATLKYLFRLHAGRISVIRPQTRFHVSFQVNGKLYIREVDRGLMQLVDGKLKLVPGSQRFADHRIYALLPLHGADAKPGELLVGTRSQGWFVYDGKQFLPWHSDAEGALNKAAIYAAMWLADGQLAVATLRDGLFLLDAHGHLMRHLTRVDGLGTNSIFAMYQDRQHGLWLATGDGITRIAVDSPLTHFSDRSGLHGDVVDIARLDGTLYAATTEGLFKLAVDGTRSAHFEQLPGMRGQQWSIAAFNDQLLVAGNDGVFAVKPDGETRQLLNVDKAGHAPAAQALLRSHRNPSRVFVSYRDGLGVLLWTGNHWVDKGRIPAVHQPARTLFQDAAGHLWMGLWTGGIDRLSLPAHWQGPGHPRGVQLEHFGTSSGLPGGLQHVVTVNGQVRFITNRGIYLFDPDTQRFAPDPQFKRLFPDGRRNVVGLYQGQRDTLWMSTISNHGDIKETGRAERVNGHWKWTVSPLQPISGTGVFAFHTDPSGVVWLGAYQNLYRYDPEHRSAKGPQFNALIRGVTARDGHALAADHADASTPEIPYSQNALRFDVAAPSFDFPGANRFQVYLEGVDHGWPPWTRDTHRDYTNLHEGSYRFMVRARNVYGQVSKVASFAFVVLPPWYRTGWAWALWIASGVLILGLLLRMHSATLKRRNRALAALVDERTAALQQANAALARQSVTDPLTGLKNRRYLHEHIEQDLATYRRKRINHKDERRGSSPHRNLLFLMVDIDHFKRVNDTHGHAAGDRVLQQVGELLLTITRDADTPIRWGGEEFLILAHEALPEIGPSFAERVRASVAAHHFDLGNGATANISCSVGFASYPLFHATPDQFSWEKIVDMADACMYAAKTHSRNAWAGVMPMQTAPDADPFDALARSLDEAAPDGPMLIETSWARVGQPA